MFPSEKAFGANLATLTEGALLKYNVIKNISILILQKTYRYTKN